MVSKIRSDGRGYEHTIYYQRAASQQKTQVSIKMIS